MKRSIEIKKRDMVTRSILLRAETIDEKTRSVDAVLNTEKEVLVRDWENWNIIREILLTDGMKFKGDQVVMLDAHNRGGNENVIGSIRNIRTENGENIGTLVFADGDEKAEAIWNKVRQGHITDVSAGYGVDNSVDIKPGSNAEINGRKFENNGREVLRITSEWTLREGSPVPIGANDEAKIREEIEREIPTKKIYEPGAKERAETEKTVLEIKMTDDEKRIEKEAAETKKREAVEKVSKTRSEEIDQIFTIAEQWGKRELAQKMIKENKSLDEFRAALVNEMDTKPEIDANRADIGLSEKEVNEYQIGNAIRSIVMEDKKAGGLEFEVSRELAKKFGIQARQNAFFIPNEVMHRFNHIDPDIARRWPNLNSRAMTTSTAAGVVGTETLGGSFIDLLRSAVALTKLGAGLLTGLRGNISIPKLTAAGTFEWVDEGGAVTGGDPTIGSVAGSPKTGRGKATYSKQLLAQSNPSIDGLVLNDQVRFQAIGIDAAGINGDGTNGAPTGILNTSGIGSVDCSSVSRANIIEFGTDIKSANAHSLGSTGWLMPATVEGLLKNTEMVSGYPKYLLEDGKMDGAPTEISEQTPASTLIKGIFSQIMLLMWGVLELQIDPYTRADYAEVVIRSFSMTDWLVRQPAAFSASENVA